MRGQIKEIVQELFDVNVEPQVSIPEEQFGDLATNVAMQITKQVGKNPREIAEGIADKLRSLDSVAEVIVAGPGFINVRFLDSVLVKGVSRVPELIHAGKTVICEYSDMNAFKTAHVGHLYTTLVGDVVANLYEAVGAHVIRANFGGDVGLHVGKAMWAILRYLDIQGKTLDEVPAQERSAWVAARYIEGNTAYESSDVAKSEIDKINKQVYELHATHDRESAFAQVYWTCREWSYDGFEAFYEQLGLRRQPDGNFFKYYPESMTAPIGAALVQKGLESGVFTRSEGAAVYDGEAEGLHTRVFMTSKGLPTYEAKDLGLAAKKWEEYHYDLNVIITANDICEYMKVILAALRKLLPETDGKTHHLTHGLVKLSGGEKMSSRKGNVLLPDDVLEAARAANRQLTGKDDEQAVLGAVKYAFLKNRVGSDIIYDPAESVSIHGNSGPYLQYAHARAKSILRKVLDYQTVTPDNLEAGERTLVRKLAEYPATIELAALESAPHHVCTYLYELSQVFNRFYEENKVIGSKRQNIRLWIVERYTDTLKNGLTLLGIHAPEQM